MNANLQRPPISRPQTNGGLFSLVEGLRQPLHVGKAELPVTGKPQLSNAPTMRPPMYTPPSTAPPSSKNFIPPISGMRTSNTVGLPTPSRGASATASAAEKLGGGKPSTPSSGMKEQLPMPQLRRPPSTGATTGAAFHKGLVNALQDVLRKQRNGVFPGPDGVDEVTARPGTQSAIPRVGSSSGSHLNGAANVEELIRRKKTEWAQRRWHHLQQKERKDLERDVSSASLYSRRQQRSANGSGGFVEGMNDDDGLFDDDEFGFATMQILQSLERQEIVDRDRITQQATRMFCEMQANFTQFIKLKHQQFPSASASHPEDDGGSSISGYSSSGVFGALPKRPPSGSTSSGVSSPKTRPNSSNVSALFPNPSGVTMSKSNNQSMATGSNSSVVFGGMAVNPCALRAMNAEDLRAEGNRYYEQNEFCLAHKMYSLAIEADPNNPVLLANRAASNMMLLNYDACAKDCLNAVGMDPTNVKVLQRLSKAYAMMGQHRPAIKHYQSAIYFAQEQVLPAALQQSLNDEYASLGALEKMRRASELEQFQECIAQFGNLKAFQGEPPVVFLRCSSLLSIDANQARQELSKYFATLECPTTYGTSSSDTVLTGMYSGHYCDVLVLLAKASFYCGQHYVTIASAYVKQCLALRPEYRQAVQLNRIITTLEAKMEETNLLIQSSKFAEAHATLSLALALDVNNKKLRSSLFVMRAEMSIKVGNTAAAISDCTSALEGDPVNVKALTRRAKCFTDIGDFSRAVRDMERAVELNPLLSDDLRSMKQQQRDDSTSFANFHRTFSAGTSRQQESGPSGGASRPGTGRNVPPIPSPRQQGPCHYQTLDIPRFSSTEQVKAQYKKLILQYHPDKVVNQPPQVREQCAVKFREISAAYSVLVDSNSKFLYDCSLKGN